MRKALATLTLSIILLVLVAVLTTYNGATGTGFSVLDNAASFLSVKGGGQIITGKATPNCAEKYGTGYGCYKGSSCDKSTFKDPTGTTCAAQGSLYICCKEQGSSSTPTTTKASSSTATQTAGSTCSNPDHPFSCGGTCWNDPCQCGIACIDNQAQCLPCAQTSFANALSCPTVGGICVGSVQQCPSGYEINTAAACAVTEKCCVLGAATQGPGLLPPCGKYGDVDDDGFVTSVDALFIGRYLAGSSSVTFIANRADVDGNGIIEIADAQLVLRYVSGIDTTFQVCSQTDLITSSPGGTANPIAGRPVTFSASITKPTAGGVGTVFKTKLAIDVNNDNSPDVFPPEQTSVITSTYSEVVVFINAWTAVEGTHKFEICADSGNDLIESNEDNNCVSQVFAVAPAPSCDEQTCGTWTASTCGSTLECLGKRMQSRTCSDTDCVTSRCVDDAACTAPQTTTRVWASSTFYEYSGSGCANNNPDGWCPAIDAGSTNDRVAEVGFNLSHVSGTVNIARICAYHYSSSTSSTSGQTTMNYITKTSSNECDKPDQLSSPPLFSGSAVIDLRSGTFGWKCVDIGHVDIINPGETLYLRWWGDDLNGATRPFACYRGPATALLSGCGGSNPSGAQDCRPYLEITGALTVTATTSTTSTTTSTSTTSSTSSTSSTTSSTMPCVNECSPAGYKECQGTGSNGLPRYAAVCGNFDSDSCLEYQLTDCNALTGAGGPGFCNSGECRFAGTTTTPSTTMPGQTTTTTITTVTTTTVTTTTTTTSTTSTTQPGQTTTTISTTTTTLQHGVTYSNFACSGLTCSVNYNNQAGQAIKVIYFLKDSNGAIVQIAQDANRPQGAGTSSITFICSTPGTYDVSAAFYANSETNYSNRLEWTKSYESQTVSC